MSDIIVICNWDSDSGMNHPISKERLPNNGECYILLVTDKVQFIDDLIHNRFELSERVHSSFLYMLEREKEYNKLAGTEDENFCNLNSGYYDFGNYSIQIIEKQSIVEL